MYLVAQFFSLMSGQDVVNNQIIEATNNKGNGEKQKTKKALRLQLY